MTIARLIAGRDQRIVHCTPQETVRDAARRLAENRIGAMPLRRIRHLPVLDGDRLVAFISIGDLVKHRLELVESEAQQMRDYIRMA